jgi:hypothetical protein
LGVAVVFTGLVSVGVMKVGAEMAEVGQVGLTPLFPWDDMVGVALVPWNGAPGLDAAAIALDGECEVLERCGKSSISTEIDYGAFGVLYRRVKVDACLGDQI